MFQKEMAMRRILYVIVMVMTAIAARAEYGEMNVGSYYTRGFKSGMDGVGVSFKGYTSYNKRRVMSLEHYFKKDGLSCYVFNYESNYLIEVGQRLRLFPASGISVAMWHSHGGYDESDAYLRMDKKNKYKVGINLGAGAECLINEHWLIAVEGKYQSMFEMSNQFVLLAGVHYRF